jgi:thiol-disulfide isomerase/thioredoxin
VELDKAEKWANEAVQSLNEDSENSKHLNYNINLAYVYNAVDNQKKALTILQKVEDYASIYNLSYWLNLGNAYINNKEKEKAVDSFINGMLWRQTPELLSALSVQGITEKEITEKVENLKNELMNFHPEKFKEEGDFSGRVVVAELFTGAECAPCKGADLALDLIAEYYPRSVVTILEYHLHVPRPDPLTNPDTEARRQFYGSGFGTPTIFFNGKGKITGGGSELVKKEKFNKYKKSIEKYFTSKPTTNIKLDAKLKDGVIEVNSEVGYSSKPEDNLSLNIALVEKSVDYIGGNGVTKHAFVVRYLMTDAEGEPIDFESGTFKYSDSIGINTIQNRQLEYLSRFEKNPPKRFRNFAGWNERKVNLNLEEMAIVAWVQNPETKEILQSQYSDL